MAPDSSLCAFVAQSETNDEQAVRLVPSEQIWSEHQPRVSSGLPSAVVTFRLIRPSLDIWMLPGCSVVNNVTRLPTMECRMSNQTRHGVTCDDVLYAVASCS